jgi:hypothetical protein
MFTVLLMTLTRNITVSSTKSCFYLQNSEDLSRPVCVSDAIPSPGTAYDVTSMYIAANGLQFAFRTLSRHNPNRSAARNSQP